MKKVAAYTDGACEGNPGPGGWAAVLMCEGSKREISGGEPATTNNRMELQAAIEALAALKEPCEVEMFTDSQYVLEGITKWVSGWKRKGWRTAAKKPVKNVELWRRLDELVTRHRVAWSWVKGHAGHEYNERCDVLACAEAAAFRRTHTPAQLRQLLDAFRVEQAAAAGAAEGRELGLTGGE